MKGLNDLDARRFDRDGFCVVPGLVNAQQLAEIRGLAESALEELLAPLEYEADVGYPGAPTQRSAVGGDTPRRLLHAISRARVFRGFAVSSLIGDQLRALINTPRVLVSQCHHNCIMTKHPGFSSRTGWHQDIRYWSFDRPELVSTWLALGRERPENGALKVIPGSHRWELDRGRFDAAMFLRDDLPENQPLFEQAVSLELEPGDVLFFHCRLFHAASENRSEQVKLSIVFTYHAFDNQAIPGTRSANYPSLPVE